jgi:hypothetical protein
MKSVSILLVASCIILFSGCKKKQEEAAEAFVGTWLDQSGDCPLYWTLEAGGDGDVYSSDCNGTCFGFGGGKAFEANLNWSNSNLRLKINITGGEKICGVPFDGAFTNNNDASYNMFYTFSANRDTIRLVIDAQGNKNTYIRQ